jgi:phosphohistidine phosphatase
MRIYLSQHGCSEKNTTDGESVLTSQGKEETALIASVARGYNVAIKRLIHSGKKRAHQTAEIFHEQFENISTIEAVAGILPLDDVTVFADAIDAYSDSLIVGHLPFMEKFLSYLTTGSTDHKVYTFQNSGIVCLESEPSANDTLVWSIKWTLNPQIT